MTLGEYRCVTCPWGARVEDMVRVDGCPECGSTVRGYDDLKRTESLLRFMQ
jgi:predicted RNA-binding Zn-ribbon protein involved in translation (DUF1610 family)